MDRDAPPGGAVFTVGHSNHTLLRFLGLLKEHRIGLLVDVRSHPRSRFLPHFGKARLEPALREAGIEYLFLGKELGGRPREREFHDAKGRVLYSRLERTPAFREGIRRVEEEAALRRTAVLCAEEDPFRCHRRLLVGRALVRDGLRLIHLRGDGRVQAEEELPLPRSLPERSF